MHTISEQTVELLVVAAVAVTMLIQAIVMLAVLSAVRAAAKSMREDIADVRSAIVPVVDNVRELMVRTAPNLESATVDLAAMTHNLRHQTADVQTAANEILDRIRQQSARVDQKLTDIFDAVDRATHFMTDSVSKPLRQISGILASAKAVIETLRTEAPPAQAPGVHAAGDKDMFV